MRVIKRDGRLESAHFDKITARMDRLVRAAGGLSVDTTKITQQVIRGFYDTVTTVDLDNMSARICAMHAGEHSDYHQLAGMVMVSNLHKSTPKTFSECTRQLAAAGLLQDGYVEFVTAHADDLDSMIQSQRDFRFDYLGYQTLAKGYLLKEPPPSTRILETPQYMYLRVAVHLFMPSLSDIAAHYNYQSCGLFTHATPTLFNAGTRLGQLASCFLLGIDDSINGIYKCLGDAALISKRAGGIGVNVTNIRGQGSIIKGTNGTSDGIIPMLRVFNETARYVNQGGKRNGAIAVYLEVWHPDIRKFLRIRDNRGDENERTRDLFPALWVCDEFMRRVDGDGDWSLMDPSECPGLVDSWGDEFDQLYRKYESEGRAKLTIKARDLMGEITRAQCETGLPYVMFKDSVNRANGQANLGVVRGSNLCSEITLYSDADHYAVCNLMSLCLHRMVSADGAFDFRQLSECARWAVRALNRVIDRTFCPVPEAAVTNDQNRPIGLGIQGLAETFFQLGLDFDSPDAAELNRAIAEEIYLSAVESSADLADQDGPYLTFAGSPASEGKLQPTLWGVTPKQADRYRRLCERVATGRGLRNSTLIALMPTASTSAIQGATESFEPIPSNAYVRQTLSGDFLMVNKYLVQSLETRGLWTPDLAARIKSKGGRLRDLTEIPPDIRRRFRTVWDVPQRLLIEYSAARGPYVCQSQSLNLYFDVPTPSKLMSALVHGWRLGLKTGSYYIRSRPVATSSLPPPATTTAGDGRDNNDGPVCVRGSPACESCSS